MIESVTKDSEISWEAILDQMHCGLSKEIKLLWEDLVHFTPMIKLDWFPSRCHKK